MPPGLPSSPRHFRRLSCSGSATLAFRTCRTFPLPCRKVAVTRTLIEPVSLNVAPLLDSTALQSGSYYMNKLLYMHHYKHMPFTAHVHLMIYQTKPKLRVQRTNHRFRVCQHRVRPPQVLFAPIQSIHSFADNTPQHGSCPPSIVLHFHTIPTAYFPLSSAITLIS